MVKVWRAWLCNNNHLRPEEDAFGEFLSPRTPSLIIAWIMQWSVARTLPCAFALEYLYFQLRFQLWRFCFETYLPASVELQPRTENEGGLGVCLCKFLRSGLREVGEGTQF